MKRFIQTIFLVGGFLTVAGLVMYFQSPLGVNAQSDGCSLATLKGAYIYGYDGFSLDEGQQVPLAYAGREEYDGTGNMTGVFSGSFNGEALTFDIFVDASTGDFYFTAVDEGETNQGFNKKVQ